MSGLIQSVVELFKFLGPQGTALALAATGVWVFILFCMWQAMSDNPKRHPDSYVKSHMGEFHYWFLRHPEDRSRYE